MRRLFIVLSRSADGVWYLPLFLCPFLIDTTLALPCFTAAVIAFAIERPLYRIGKHTFKRTRPCNHLLIAPLLPPPDEFSFPSGHSSGAFTALTVFAGFFPVTYVPLMIWAIGVAISRVYSSVHYPLDVVVGALLGTCCGKLALYFAHTLIY